MVSRAKKRKRKKVNTLQEVSGVWGGPSSSHPHPPMAGLLSSARKGHYGQCHQPLPPTPLLPGTFLAGRCQFGPKSLYRLPKAHCMAVYFNKGA